MVRMSGAPGRQPGQGTTWGGEGYKRVGAGVECGIRMDVWLLGLSVGVEGRSAAYNKRERERGRGAVARETGRGRAVSPPPPSPPRITP